ncbi:InlB B-repeat-containing protein [Peptoniphilus sp. GNH]|nr:InlB B-repeat-containing protein [Peptoniphilus sp. GNH]
MENYLKKMMTLILAILMLLSAPIGAFAEVNKEDNINYDITPLMYKRDVNKLDVKPAKADNAKEFVKNPVQPNIYTFRTDYKVQRGEYYRVNYQPYVATVGEKASEDEKAKVNRDILIPDMPGYDKPTYADSFKIDYKTVKSKAEGGEQTANKFEGKQEFKYKAKENEIKVKHIFQSLEDFSKYTNSDGSVTDQEGRYIVPVNPSNKKGDKSAEGVEKITLQKGNTGSTITVNPLEEKDRPGYVQENDYVSMQVPDDASNFKIEYRYRIAHYDVIFDTDGGTPIPSRTLYYSQEIPKIDEKSIPKKDGCVFLGWKPSNDIVSADNRRFKKDNIITKADGRPSLDLDVKLKMPALKLGNKVEEREKLVFKATWKEKEKADFAVQFWAEKADHADNASFLEKYEYIGTHIYKDIDRGFRPYLADMPINGIKFPDLDDARLKKIWSGAKFYKNMYKELNKFYVYNKELTERENLEPIDPEHPNKVREIKPVSSTGKTVYNIYYDRQVYDLYFTKSNALSDKETFYPEIWGYDSKKYKQVRLGGPGDPYHFKARFNEVMYKWPNDAMQTKGFTPGLQSFGWGPNYSAPNWPRYLDTPPYRLNADEFVDMENYDSWGGYVKEIDGGNGVKIKAKDFTTISFGIKQQKDSIPHHMDFWMDGFKPNEKIIAYDLVRTKADTSSLTYGHKYPIVQGFTPYGYNAKSGWPSIKEGEEEHGRVSEDDIDNINDEREEITPYPETKERHYDIYGNVCNVGQLNFIKDFFNDADEFGDSLDGDEFEENGYLRFFYHRNKYPLRFNYDPSKTKGDDEFNSTNSLETLYQFPLVNLDPKIVAKEDEEIKAGTITKREKFKIDNPQNLKEMGLNELIFVDPKDGKLKVKRPDNITDQMEFKGWALDPAGTKLIYLNENEIMPTHPVNLYAKWAEPDYRWKITFDSNGGNLKSLSENEITTERKTIKVGDIGFEEKKTYPEKDENSDKDKQIFTVVQRQKLVKPVNPERKGYDFMGWEVIRYKKNAKGDYTEELDEGKSNDYKGKYKVPELYAFGNDVVSPLYLKAIWVPNQKVDIKVKHYMLDNDYKLDARIKNNPREVTLEDKRAGYMVATVGEMQNSKYILASKDELGCYKDKDGNFVEGRLDNTEKVIDGKTIKEIYKDYNEKIKLNNSFFQTFEVVPKRILDAENKLIDNPNFKENESNIFRFFYRPFRTRNYKVNYIDERGKEEIENCIKKMELGKLDDLKDDEYFKRLTKEEQEAKITDLNKANKVKFGENKAALKEILDKYSIVAAESVISQCRHYDARNYRPIPGWVLADGEKPQKQLFYDVNENTNELLGINGTGADEIIFYYKDARVIEVTDPKDPVPDGYVRVTFKVDETNKGGVFKDKAGKEVTAIYYDVIKGLKSDKLPHPIIWEDGKDASGNPKAKEEGRYYITPDSGKSFSKWDNEKWLNESTDIQRPYTFTAYFDWSGAAAKGMVITEAFKDDKADATKNWSNKFAPTLENLKKQIVWKEKVKENGREKLVEKELPQDTTVELFDDKDQALTDEKVFELVNEKKKADKDELVRTVNIKAKVKFKDKKDTQELVIPIKIYKNVYEALNENADKPKFLSDAEKLEAKDGGLKDVTGDYIKVRVKPNKDFDARDSKVYYVNKNAWVEIPKIDTAGDSRFTNWTADKKAQNEEEKENGIFDFTKRHKFTEETLITPRSAQDVVEQTDPANKPDVPASYVKVIIDKTEKAALEADEKQSQTFWVNPTKEVAITVSNPKGKEDQEVELKDNNGESLGTQKVKYNFDKWQKIKEGADDNSLTDLNPVLDIDLAKNKFTQKVTLIKASYEEEIDAKELIGKSTIAPLDTPKGKEITSDILKGKITPPDGKQIGSIQVISTPNKDEVGKAEAKVIIKYTDGTTEGSDANPIKIPVEVHDNIVKAGSNGERPKEALENYVKITLKAKEGGKLEGTLTGDFIYYVSPEVEIDLEAIAASIKKTPDTGYFVNGENWTNANGKTLKGQFAQEAVFEFEFEKSNDIITKTDDSVKKPEGYVTVTFKTDGNGKVDGKDEIVYFVNPNAGIKIGQTKTPDNKTIVIPKVTANEDCEFKEWQENIDEGSVIKGNKEFVAIFKAIEKTVTLIYENGGADVRGTVPDAIRVKVGTVVNLANKGKLQKENAVFAGWKIDDTTYGEGDQITLNENKTAIAQWTSTKHTVTFISMGGSNVKSQEVSHGQKLQAFDEPKLEGKVFVGWKEKGKENEAAYFDLNTSIEENKTLIATWQDPVKEIRENDQVEPQFIKVSFKQEANGSLNKEEVTYKVAKDLSFEDAKQAGMKVPEIKAAKYYKAIGWDKELKLEGQDIVFNAKYESEDIIPIDPNIPDDQIKANRPDGMIIVTFKVAEADTDKAFIKAIRKFYVRKDKEVTIDPPTVYNKTMDYTFKGWEGKTLENNKLVITFTEDTEIKALGASLPQMEIQLPRAGYKTVYVLSNLNGASGKLAVKINGTWKEYTAETKTVRSRRGRRIISQDFTTFTLEKQLIAGDQIRYWAEKDGVKSEVREYTVKSFN